MSGKKERVKVVITTPRGQMTMESETLAVAVIEMLGYLTQAELAVVAQRVSEARA